MASPEPPPTPDAAPGEPPPTLDPAQVEALRDSMTAEDLAMLADLVTAEIADRTTRLAAALAPDGPQRADLVRQAHQLLGCARSIGAERLAEAAGRLEATAATASPEALAEAVATIAVLGEAARVAFTAMVGGDAARSRG